MIHGERQSDEGKLRHAADRRLGAGIIYMFREHELHRIMASHMPRNLRSAALLDRLGFEREGYARAYLRIDGRWEDMVLRALIQPGD